MKSYKTTGYSYFTLKLYESEVKYEVENKGMRRKKKYGQTT
jgi:hypothetical protein